MQANDPNRRGLSEISHLFLSSVRDRQTQGAPRPTRTPPKAAVNIELTPEEVAQPAPAVAEEISDAAHHPPITALLATHLNGKQFEYVMQYARHLAATCGRVGMIEVGISDLRLMCFDPSGAPGGEQLADATEQRQVSEALAELNCDVNHWLVLTSPTSGTEAMDLLRNINRWVLLSTCDHDGIVSSYRLLKGLSDNLTSRPNLSLALLDAKDETEANRVAGKLGGVCTQFLSWNLETEGTVEKSARVAEHLVLNAHLGAPFTAVAQFIAETQAAQQAEKPEPVPAEVVEEEPMDEGLRQLVADLVIPTDPAPAQFPRVAESHPEVHAEMGHRNASDVLDLDGIEATPEAVVNLILKQTPCGAIECPVRPPMCSESRLTVTREKTLELFASTELGLGNLRGIANAYRWLTENRGLIAMAMPQFAIDATRLPRLRLIVDQADLSAGLLEPMLQNGQITVQSFRRLRWGAKTGLLLEAA
jgi:hypothetical protein